MKKIMFNNRYGLTDAVLIGLKTMTRRIIRQSMLDKAYEFQQVYYDATLDSLIGVELLNQFFFIEKIGKLPYQVGEVVAIAQCYKDLFEEDCLRMMNGEPMINVTVKNVTNTAGWNNKMFVRADQMPHHIRFSDIQIERLQDISDEDCIAEGVREIEVDNNWGKYATHTEYRVVYTDKYGREKLLIGMTPQEAYATLIDRISGKGTWESNPYVFAYEFELVD